LDFDAVWSGAPSGHEYGPQHLPRGTHRLHATSNATNLDRKTTNPARRTY
jgi:hypothetical protein